MNFLAPWFLLGGLALGLPVVFHLIQRTTRDRTPFSSLRFVTVSPPRLTKRSRLEDLLLLLVRCLALLLLALGFARPFLPRSELLAGASGTQRLLILIDSSASMRRTGVWAEAVRRAESALSHTQTGDQVALYTFDRELKPILTFSEWMATASDQRLAIARSRLATLSPSWASTQLASCVERAAEIVAERDGEKSVPLQSRLLLISDQQEGSHADSLAGYEWPPGVSFEVVAIAAQSRNNAGLHWAPPAGLADIKPSDPVQVRVSNASESQRDRFQVGWSDPSSTGFKGNPVEVTVPPGQTRTVTLPVRPDPALQSVRLRGDDDAFDNEVFIPTPVSNHRSVAYFGTDPATDTHQPLFFLKSALPGTGPNAVEVHAYLPTSLIPTNDWAASSLLVVTDPLPDSLITPLRTRLDGGSTVLLSMKSVAISNTLAQLAGVPGVSLEEAAPPDFALLGEIDFQHPVFAPFTDPKFHDFTRIHFWKYRRLDAASLPKARVVARFDHGDPAILQLDLGTGRLIILTSSWAPVDSQWALSTKFVPWLLGILEPEAVVETTAAQLLVGDPWTFSPNTEPRTMRFPDGHTVPVPTGTTQFNGASTPGIYRLDGAGSSRVWAVNLDPSESRTTPIDSKEWARFGAPVGPSSPAAVAPPPLRASGAETEGQQKLWRWFLVATLLILGAESIVTGLRRLRQAQPTPSLA